MLFLLYLMLIESGICQTSLGGYNVDPESWSVSGISSGAAMANQMHVAYSSDIVGVGIIAGVVYYCAESSSLRAINPCMQNAAGVDVGSLVSATRDFANEGSIDPVSSMNGDKVYIFAGSVDSVVDPGNGANLEQYYNNYFTDTATEYGIAAEHSMPTDNYGGPCNQLNSEYINNCNYNAAYELLDHIYGGLTRPSGSTPLNGQLYEYNQRDFFDASLPANWGMDNTGWVYVPSACLGGTLCRLHVAFHGCQQGQEYVGDAYVTHAGYNEVGELNNIIILYPQAVDKVANPQGCWDWWSYNSCFPYPDYCYATKDGGQPLAVYRMMRQVSGLAW